MQVMQWIADCETPVVYISFGTVVDLHATQVCTCRLCTHAPLR